MVSTPIALGNSPMKSVTNMIDFLWTRKYVQLKIRDYIPYYSLFCFLTKSLCALTHSTNLTTSMATPPMYCLELEVLAVNQQGIEFEPCFLDKHHILSSIFGSTPLFLLSSIISLKSSCKL